MTEQMTDDRLAEIRKMAGRAIEFLEGDGSSAEFCVQAMPSLLAEVEQLRHARAELAVLAKTLAAASHKIDITQRALEKAAAEVERFRAERDRYQLAWQSARRGRAEARAWAKRHFNAADQARATAHGLGRDYRQARAEADRALTILRALADEKCSHPTEPPCPHDEAKALIAEIRRPEALRTKEATDA